MKTLISATAVALTFSCSSAFALEKCATVENDLDRLACYDKVSGRTPKTEVTKSDQGDWLVRKDKSDFEDTTDVFLSVDSTELATCNRFGGQEKARLLIRCMENTTAVMLITNCHLASGHGGYGIIDYRIDDQKTHDRNFEASTDNKALGLWRGGSSIPFIKKLLGSDRVLMRFTAYGQSPTTVEFNTTGIDEAIEPLRQECGW